MSKQVPESKEARAVRQQFAALPWRPTGRGDVEVMLITSRTTRRWIVPKGWPVRNLKPSESAAVEAFEEAGVRGVVGRRAIGVFRYEKFIDDEGRSVPCDVKVFALRVKHQLADWPEREQRDLRWLSPAQACSLVADAGLRSIIEAFGASRRLQAAGER